MKDFFKNPFGTNERGGYLGGSVMKWLPLAQVMIPGSRDGVPHQDPTGSLLLPLPMSLPLSVSLMNKENLKRKKKKQKERDSKD